MKEARSNSRSVEESRFSQIFGAIRRVIKTT